MKTKILKYIDKNFPSLENKNIFISGGTGEIGQAIIEILNYLNANIYLGYRDIIKANIIKEKYPKIELVNLDLNDIKSVINSVDDIKSLNMDYIIHNAGVSASDLKMNEMVNFYGPYYMIKELKDIKHIIVGSISYKKNNKNDYYSTSKKELLQICYLLNNAGYDIRTTHPGIVDTKLFRNRNKGLLVNLIRPFMNNPMVSSLSIVSGIINKPKSNEWIGPKGLCESFGYPGISKINGKLFDSEELNNVEKKIKEINSQMEENYGF